MKQRPGVMIYFDIRGVLNMLSMEERGSILTAMLVYGEDGVFDDRELVDKAGLIWPFIQMSLDRDNARYQEISLRNRYANYVRWQRERGEEILSREAWETAFIPLEDPLG